MVLDAGLKISTFRNSTGEKVGVGGRGRRMLSTSTIGPDDACSPLLSGQMLALGVFPADVGGVDRSEGKELLRRRLLSAPSVPEFAVALGATSSRSSITLGRFTMPVPVRIQTKLRTGRPKMLPLLTFWRRPVSLLSEGKGINSTALDSIYG